MGLLDTVSRVGSLINKPLVKECGFTTNKSNVAWDINNNKFKSGEFFVVNNLHFLQFTNKRKINELYLHNNPNTQQTYDIIFRLDFLIKNEFDILLSIEVIIW